MLGAHQITVKVRRKLRWGVKGKEAEEGGARAAQMLALVGTEWEVASATEDTSKGRWVWQLQRSDTQSTIPVPVRPGKVAKSSRTCMAARLSSSSVAEDSRKSGADEVYEVKNLCGAEGIKESLHCANAFFIKCGDRR